MTHIKQSFAVVLAFVALLAIVAAPPCYAQATLSSTTLSQAVTGPGVGSTGPAAYPSTIYLTSLTGITAPAQPTSTSEIGSPTGSSFTILYVDKEAMQVLSVNTNITAVSVNRGYLGTVPTAHTSGATVYFGPPQYFGNVGYYSNSGPAGACTAAAQRVQPLIETDTGDQWNCYGGVWVRQNVAYSLLQGSCSGTASASATLGLYGLGEYAALACTSTVTTLGPVQPVSGSIRRFTVTATTGGVSSSSGVFTVLKNGSATTVTCTTGTATSCSDTTHVVSFVAGDVLSVQFTTQGSETLAGVKAQIVVQ